MAKYFLTGFVVFDDYARAGHICEEFEIEIV